MRSVPRPVRLAAGAVSTALAASLLLAAPAHAETQNTYDPLGDASFGGDADFPGREGVEESADIRRLRVDVADGTVRALIRVDDLTLASTDYTSASVRFLTDAGEDLVATLTGRGLRKGATLRETDGGQVVGCDGLEARRSALKDRYVLSLPTSCLGDPAGFRFGAQVSIADITSGNPDCCPNGFTDDARRDGEIGNRIRLGTRTIATD